MEIKEKVDINLDSKEFFEKHGRKKTVFTFTLGCKVNSYETESMIEKFEAKGYEVVSEEEFADVCIINTCTVTNLSDRKSRQVIRRVKKHNPNAIVAAVGCYVQVAEDKVREIEEIDVIAGTKDKYKIVELCEEFAREQHKIAVVSDIMKNRVFDESEISETDGMTRAYIKIQEGCNNFCSYCIIPYARGPIRSRLMENIVKEVKRLVSNGYKEVVLTGIHVGSYGKDLGEQRLVDVIEEVANVEGVDRIRLSSLEPTYITHDFLERMKSIDSFCPHFHLSLQSGCDSVLQRMNRKYNTKEYLDAVDDIRSFYPDAAITTDIIVGFPGETDEEFKTTVEFVKTVRFAEVHVFRYSPRSGTVAAERKDQVDGNVKNERSKILIDVVEMLSNEFKKSQLGKSYDVLFEQHENGHVVGHTKNYLKVGIEGEIEEGAIASVKLEKVLGNLLIGILN
jgi:threonylcarbamoyladenosine tRNA methylthiotransferase MtaB